VTVVFNTDDADNIFLEAINNIVAVADDNNTIMDYPVDGNVLFNDYDPDSGTTPSILPSSEPLEGLVVDLNGDGIPETNADASINDAGGIVIGGTTLAGTPVLSTDNSGAGAGTLIINDDGSYTFEPATGFTGEVTVEYTICDDGVPQACGKAMAFS
jgi:hypothetical protein